MKNKLKKLCLTAAALIGMHVQTQAVPISGDILFQVTATASGASGVGLTTISFINPGSVTFADGDYSTVLSGTPVIFGNLSFTGSGLGAVLSASVAPEWTFTSGGNTYSFDLTSLISASVAFQTAKLSNMSLSGTGTAYINGLNGTVATWTLSGTDGNTLVFKAASESTTATGTSVPDGGITVALLGFALVGLEGVRRRFSK